MKAEKKDERLTSLKNRQEKELSSLPDDASDDVKCELTEKHKRESEELGAMIQREQDEAKGGRR